MTRRPNPSFDRNSLIAQANSAAHCWFIVGGGLVLIALLGGFVQGA